MKERSAMSMAKRMGTCVRALVISGAFLIGGVLVAGPAAADEHDTVNGCRDTSTYSLEQADAASGNASLTRADELSGGVGMTEVDQRAGNIGMTALEESSGSASLTEADAHTTAWMVDCNM
jgi:hypothetical protein